MLLNSWRSGAPVAARVIRLAARRRPRVSAMHSAVRVLGGLSVWSRRSRISLLWLTHS